jgi:nucleotide-binding universal stress UspA family protein
MKVLLAWDAAGSTRVEGTVRNDSFLQWIDSCAWPAGTTFYIMTVVEPLPDLAQDLETELMERAALKAEGWAAGLRAKGLKAVAVARQGDPGSAIVHEAAELHANLIIAGAPGPARGPLHLVTGSVARRVLRFASCSVRICRRSQKTDNSGFRVLLPVDGSDYSKAAVASVTGRLWPDQTVFEVVSVVEPVSASVKYLLPGYTESADASRIRAATMQAAQDAIKSAEQVLIAAGLKVMDTVMVPLAAPGELIVEEAARWQADLIVMGSYGHRGVTRFLLGSVSEAVALHAGCSVEVYRSPALASSRS